MTILKIELRSALCAADGDGHASVIDTDICTDEFGIPYIPARRLKGCLREAADYIGIDNEKIEKLFGKSGSRKSGLLLLTDAVLPNHDALVKELKANKQKSDAVTRLFTDIRAATAISKEGCVEAETLRFVRVVNQKQPWNFKENLIFCANVSEIDDAEMRSVLEKCCKALRHIGFKRTRGFGAVKCTLEPVSSKSASAYSVPKCENGKQYRISYAVKNISDLMLGGRGAGETQSFISGTAVRGLLAEQYLKQHDADAEFARKFLSGAVTFSNLYISDEAFKEYLPVPAFFGKNKMEAQNTIRNLLFLEQKKVSDYKPLKEGYLSAASELLKAKTKTVYHISNVGKEQALLYTQTCLQKGQYFRGCIEADGADAAEIVKLLTETELRFGRSKTAQYSLCSLCTLDVEEITPKTVQPVKYAAFVLESDVLLTDAFGGQTVQAADLASALGLDISKLHQRSCLKHRTVMGYNTLMNLQKPHQRAFAAGSVLIFETDGNKTFPTELRIGSRQNEGFGRIRVCDAEKFLADSKPLCRSEQQTAASEATKLHALLLQKQQDAEMRLEAFKKAMNEENQKKFRDLTAAFVGRVTLMIEEADSLTDLNNRIDSIKNEKKRDTAKDLVTIAKPEHYQKEMEFERAREYLLDIFTLAKYTLKKETQKGGKTE